MTKLTHFNSEGEVAQVRLGGKESTLRRAEAYGEIQARPAVIQALLHKQLAKGDAFAAAKISAILAAKKTSELIPLCHSLSLEWVDVAFEAAVDKIKVTAVAETSGKTGVEMEALTAASVACLTLYDMMKALDKTMVIGPIYLLSKTGGKSGPYRRQANGR